MVYDLLICTFAFPGGMATCPRRANIEPETPHQEEPRSDGREHPDRAGSRSFPPFVGPSAATHRCPEYRSDEPRRLLPQLSLEVVSRRRRGAGHLDFRPRIEAGDLRNAVRGVEKEVSERGLAGAAEGLRRHP